MVAIDTSSAETIAEFVQKHFPPTKIGPTWQIQGGHWLAPEYTLGYQVIDWITENLLSPDGSGDAFTLTFEQCRYVLWLYAVDENGRFLYQNSVLQRCKGW